MTITVNQTVTIPNTIKGQAWADHTQELLKKISTVTDRQEDTTSIKISHYWTFEQEVGDEA